MDLSLVIPVFNEEENLNDLMQQIHGVLRSAGRVNMVADSYLGTWPASYNESGIAPWRADQPPGLPSAGEFPSWS